MISKISTLKSLSREFSKQSINCQVKMLDKYKKTSIIVRCKAKKFYTLRFIYGKRFRLYRTF